MSILIIGDKYKEKLEYSLSLCNFYVFWLPKNPNIDEKLCCHADLSVFIHNKTAIIAKYLDRSELVKILTNEGYTVIISKENQSNVYPGDVNLCAACCGDIIIHNRKYTDPHIIDIGLEYINVKQGYSRCSCLCLNDSLITSDKGIAAAAERNGIETLLINDNGIILEGYDKGFIGGASFVSDTTVYFTGDVDKHVDADKLKEFIAKHNYKICCLTTEQLFDIGGAIIA